MGKFEFRERSIPTEVCGEKYLIATTPEKIKKIQGMATDFRKIKPDNTEEQIKRMSAIIEEILGAGSTEKIFSGRPLNTFDLTDLIEFLTDEINKDRVTRAAALAATMNREQKHSAAKKTK